MNSILSNKKILILLIVCLAIIAVVFYFVKIRNSQSYKQQQIMDLVAKTTKSMQAEQGDEFNQTEKVNQDLFNQYLLMKNTASGAPLSTSTQNKIVENIVKNDTPSVEAKKYSLSDLKISEKVGTASLKNYGNQLGYILLKDSKNTGSRNELFILQDALRQNNKDILVQLDPKITGYSNIIKDYLSIEVPESASSAHLDLINKTSKVLNDAQSMKLAFQDPAKAISAVSAYKSDVKNLISSIYNLYEYFSKNKINFIKTDYGYIFTSLIK
jgi:hypothetical protein